MLPCGLGHVREYWAKCCDKQFTDKAKTTIERVAIDSGRSYEAIFVDARQELLPSASKLEREP